MIVFMSLKLIILEVIIIYKIVKFRAKRNVKKFFYAYRIVDAWNSLNNHVVVCTTIDSFVKNLKNVCMNNYLKGRAFK